MRTKRVLIIDDDRRMWELLTDVVEAAGFAAVAVGDAADAVWLLSQDIDLVRLDLVMPLATMDGFAFLSQARAWPELEHVPVIVLAGLGESVAVAMDAATASTLRIVAVLPKPVDITSMMTALCSALGADIPS